MIMSTLFDQSGLPMTKRLAADAPRKRIGRPTLYTEALGLALCKRIAMGESLASIYRDKCSPGWTSVYKWRDKYPSFDKAYMRARIDSADALVDQMIAIADDPKNRESSEAVQHARLMVDARKWVAAKLKPASYGEQLQVTADLQVNIAVQRFSDAPVVERIVNNTPQTKAIK